MVTEVEENFWLVDGVRDEEISPFIIDLTEEFDTDTDTDDDFDEGDGDEENDVDIDTNISDPIDDSDVQPCKVCHELEPPNTKKREKNISWFQCLYCDDWVHDKCCKGAARKADTCLRCFSILRHRELSTQLLIEPMDTES